MSTVLKASPPKSHFTAIIPVRRGFYIDPGAVVDAIAGLVEASGATVHLLSGGVTGTAPKRRGLLGFGDTAPGVVNCAIGDLEFEITCHPKPFSETGSSVRDTVAGMINPAYWSDEMAALLDHRAHIRVTEKRPAASSQDPEDLYDRAVAVSVATAAMADLSDAPAVIWLPSRNLLPRRLFGQEMERLMDRAAPLRLWLRWHVIPVAPDEALEPGVATHGLAEFAGFEMIAPPSSVSREVMLENIFHLAAKVLDEQQLPQAGMTTGADGEKIRLRHAAAGEFSETPCLVILPGSDPGDASN